MIRADGCAEADQLDILAGPRRLAGRQDVEAFQQVALALGVAPDKDVQPLPRLDPERPVIPKVFQFQDVTCMACDFFMTL